MGKNYFKDDFTLEYSSDDELCYADNGNSYIKLYKDSFFNSDFVGKLFVYLDREENDREYIIINYTVVYLDTIRIKQ